MEPVISTERITKRFRDVLAVSELSLSVGKGEIYGFLGLNGAGKTTTIRMLLGMITPQSGYATINGVKITRNLVKLWNKVGYLVETPSCYPDLTVLENLELIRRLRGVKDPKALHEVMEKLHLGQYARVKSKNLSLGNVQRLGLAKALMHQPEVLILDEPANGLDPAGIREIREMLGNLAHNHGTTVFISSHILGEVARMATRIGIIHNGVLLQEMDAGELEHLCRKKLMIQTRNNSRAVKILAENGFPAEISDDTMLVIRTTEAIANPESIATLLVHHNEPPVALYTAEEDLESYFLRTIGQS